MGIKGHNDIPEAMNWLLNRIDEGVYTVLSYAGERAVTLIRKRGKGKPNWTDRTGVLRASVGVKVYIDGEDILTIGFNTTDNKGTNPEPGISIGMQYAESVLNGDSAKWRLAVVAGANYASFVEKNDYDVVMFVKDEIERIIEELLREELEVIAAEFKRRYG